MARDTRMKLLALLSSKGMSSNPFMNTYAPVFGPARGATGNPLMDKPAMK
jgi:hypothetical protein